MILNWRAADMTLRAVAHVLEQSRPPDRVYVVDNGSKDGSAQRLADELRLFRGRVELIVNLDNRGFGGGCNAGIKAALTDGHDAIWLINNDAQPDHTCLAAMVAAAGDAPEPVGIVAPLLVDPENATPPHFGNWMHPVTLMCDMIVDDDDLSGHRFAWVSAAAILISAEALTLVGGFDERFFMYWEDADLNVRVREAGYAIVLAKEARVLHHAGTSSAMIPVQRYLWHYASQELWLNKHHKMPSLACFWLRLKYLLKAVLDRDWSRFRALQASAPRSRTSNSESGSPLFHGSVPTSGNRPE